MINAITKKRERVFFLAIASFFLVANFVGFGYSLNSRLGNEESLHFHIYVHGISAALWIVLYFVQSALATSGNIKLHTIIGKAGSVVILLVLLTGFYVAFMVPVIYNVDAPYSQPGRDFSAILLAVVIAFIGLRKRKMPFIHKRLMMTSTLILSSAGIARFINALGLSGLGASGIISMLFLPIILLIIHDYITYKKFFKINFVSITLVFLLFILSAPPFWDNPVFGPILEKIVGWLS